MTTTPTSQPGSTPAPIPRENAFFGLHFDLHPGPGDTALGADVTEENIERLLTRVRPDWVQYDCKGHAGYAGYPTKVGWAAPRIVKDSLAIWRAVTRRHGVGLYVHYSGVWDTKAIEQHPEWARIGPDGKPDLNHTSVFGPYLDELMIPQLKELVTLYDVEGVWADGECWAAQLDYSPAALAAWKQETGLDDAPRARGEAHWLEWKMFHRQAFERQVCHWVDALYAFRPGLQLTSNWMYTAFAPQPVRCALDFLSGDVIPGGALDRARFDARYLAGTGRPWDLMSWGFLWSPGKPIPPSMKTAVQLQQEAAVILSKGGAFQVYYQPTRAGHVSDTIIETLGAVADFCRARQAVCHLGTSLSDVALLLSAEEQFERSDAVYSPWGTSTELEGALHALLELHYSVHVLAEHQLQPRLGEYHMVVIPDSLKLADDFKSAVLDYVRGGGRLLLLGEKCARLFEPELGLTLDGHPAEMPAELITPLGPVNASGLWQAVTPTTSTALGRRFPDRNTTGEGQVAATLVGCGQGQIAAVFGPVAAQFHQAHHPGLRRFIGDITRRLLPDPRVELDGPATAEVSLRQTPDGRTTIHLVNLTGQPLGNRQVIDMVPPVGPLAVRLRLPQKPQEVEWLPPAGEIRREWANGILTVSIPRLEIHGVVVVTP